MRNVILFITLLGVSSCTVADDREAKYIALMEASFNTNTLLYSRISPEAAAKIKPVSVPPEAKEIAKCLVERAETEGLLAEFDSSLVLSQEYAKYIRDTPSLTYLTLGQDAQFVELQNQVLSPKFAPLQVHSKECGAIEMNIKIIGETGVYQAIASI